MPYLDLNCNIAKLHASSDVFHVFKLLFLLTTNSVSRLATNSCKQNKSNEIMNQAKQSVFCIFFIERHTITSKLINAQHAWKKPEDRWSCSSTETICSEQAYGNIFKK